MPARPHRSTALAALIACLAVAFLAAPASSVAAPAGSTAASRAVITAKSGINDLRHRTGHRSLRSSASLDRSASAYARRMLATHYFGHAPSIRASRRFRTLGEALALQSGRRPRGGRAVSMWAHSAPHYAILTSGQFRAIGVGVATGRFRGRMVTMWVAQVGR